MIKLTFVYGNNKSELVVDRIKYVYCHNHFTYWKYNRCALSTCDKSATTEYREENNIDVRILINDEHILKTDEFYYVDSKFDMDNDFKLGSKSLSLRYITTQIEQNLMNDEVNQLNLMLDLIVSSLSSDSLRISHQELNQKTIGKLLNANYLIDDFESDNLDISYDDLIIFQLKMINDSCDKTKRIIVFVDVNYLTQKLSEAMEKYSNLIIIVLFCKADFELNKNNIYFNGYDLENDNDLYERMVTMTNYYDINDFKNYLKAEYLNKNIK